MSVPLALPTLTPWCAHLRCNSFADTICSKSEMQRETGATVPCSDLRCYLLCSLSLHLQTPVLSLSSCCAVLILCMFEAWPYRRWPVGNSKPGFLPMLQGLCASQLMVLAVYCGPYSNGGVVRVEAIALYAVAYVSSPCNSNTYVSLCNVSAVATHGNVSFLIFQMFLMQYSSLFA